MVWQRYSCAQVIMGNGVRDIDDLLNGFDAVLSNHTGNQEKQTQDEKEADYTDTEQDRGEYVFVIGLHEIRIMQVGMRTDYKQNNDTEDACKYSRAYNKIKYNPVL